MTANAVLHYSMRPKICSNVNIKQTTHDLMLLEMLKKMCSFNFLDYFPKKTLHNSARFEHSHINICQRIKSQTSYMSKILPELNQSQTYINSPIILITHHTACCQLNDSSGQQQSNVTLILVQVYLIST